MKTWKKISGKKVYTNPRFCVIHDKVFRPDGTKGDYFMYESKPGVVAVPYDGKKIYLVNQYRYPVKQRCWELPAGKAENTNYLFQAKKELREETGIVAHKWKYLGKYFPTNGTSSRQGKFYLAENLKIGQPQREATEQDMYLKAFTMTELDKMVAQGKILDGWTLAGLYFFKLHLQKYL